MSIRRLALVLILSVGLVTVIGISAVNLLGGYQGNAIMCDGGVPISFIPDDYSGSGCAEVPADLLSHPERWADEEWVCLGMCGLDATDWDPGTRTWGKR